MWRVASEEGREGGFTQRRGDAKEEKNREEAAVVPHSPLTTRHFPPMNVHRTKAILGQKAAREGGAGRRGRDLLSALREGRLALAVLLAAGPRGGSDARVRPLRGRSRPGFHMGRRGGTHAPRAAAESGMGEGEETQRHRGHGEHERRTAAVKPLAFAPWPRCLFTRHSQLTTRHFPWPCNSNARGRRCATRAASAAGLRPI